MVVNKKNKKTYKLGLLGFFTIFCYCLSITIGVVWVSVGVAWTTGGFDEKLIYPESISFEYADLSFEDATKDRNNCLRITGITDEIKSQMIASAEESQKTVLENNIAVDRKFVIRGNSEEVTVLTVKLSSSDPSIATVPAEVNIGEEVSITPTLINGKNKGGFVEIRAVTPSGVYANNTLKVLVDVPVESLSVSLPSTFNSEIITDVDSPLIGEKVYYMYEGDSAILNISTGSDKSINPTINCATVFREYRLNDKINSFYLEDTNAYGNNIALNYQTGEIETFTEGVYKICSKILKTYDDEIFVTDYKFQFDWETQIPEDKLVGRYVYSYVYVVVKPIVLDRITTNNSLISINLFETKVITASELNIKLYSNRNETTYFESDIPRLQLSSSDSSVLSVVKTENQAKWTLTSLTEPVGLVLTISHPDYPDAICELENIEINIVEIGELLLEGNTKSSPNLSYNDVVEIEMQKETSDGEEIIVEHGYWTFGSSTLSIVPQNVNETKTTYSVYKLFADGVYHNGTFKLATFTNEQGQQILPLGPYYEGLGCEVLLDSTYTSGMRISALNRGEISVRACVIKTDINGNPIDKDGLIINSDQQSYEQIIVSEPVTIIVKELLRSLIATVEVDDDDASTPNGVVTIQSNNVIIVNDNSELDINIVGNSVGAMIDAINYNLLAINSVSNSNSNLDINDKVVTNIQDGKINVRFENILTATNNVEKINLTIKVYTGSQTNNGYESLRTIYFKVMEVPVQAIELNTTMTSVEDSNYYEVLGNLDIIKDEATNRVTNLSVAWGQVTPNGFLELSLSSEGNIPTFVPAQMEYGEIAPIVPKKLGVSNEAYSYTTKLVSDENADATTVCEVDKDNNILVKKLDVEIRLIVVANYDNSITDEIVLKFKLPNNLTLEWATLSESDFVFTKSQVLEGIPLEKTVFSLSIINGDDVSNPSVLYGDQGLIKFKPADANSADLVIVRDDILFEGTPERYDGQFVTFSDAPETGEFSLTAYVDVDGLIISFDYDFIIVEDEE